MGTYRMFFVLFGYCVFHAVRYNTNRVWQHHILRHVLFINIDSTRAFGKNIQPGVLRPKKIFFRRNTLCISRKNSALGHKRPAEGRSRMLEGCRINDGRVEICGLRVRRTGSCLRNEKSLLLPCRFSHPAAAYRSSSSMWLRFARYRRYFLWKTVFSPPPIGAAP